MANLEAVFHRLVFTGFKLKCKKVEIGKRQVDMLGFCISAEGVTLSPIKQKAAALWKCPETSKVLSFVQFCNFMRKHIENFSLVARPLYEYCNKEKFVWTDKCETSFEALKKAVTSAPALHLLSFDKTMYVTADWLAKAIGYALLQRENETKGAWYAVQYGSKAMTKRNGSLGASIGELKATEVVSGFQ